jgi:hypothetical protein
MVDVPPADLLDRHAQEKVSIFPGPGSQGEVREPIQLLLIGHGRTFANDKHAPAFVIESVGPVYLKGNISFERGSVEVTALTRHDVDVALENDIVDRVDNGPTINRDADPSDPTCLQQPKAFGSVKFLKLSVH